MFDAKLEPLRTDQNDVTGSFSFADIARNMALIFGALRGADLGENAPHLLASHGRMSAHSAVRQVARPMAEYLRSEGRPLPHFLVALADSACV